MADKPSENLKLRSPTVESQVNRLNSNSQHKDAVLAFLKSKLGQEKGKVLSISRQMLTEALNTGNLDRVKEVDLESDHPLLSILAVETVEEERQLIEKQWSIEQYEEFIENGEKVINAYLFEPTFKGPLSSMTGASEITKKSLASGYLLEHHSIMEKALNFGLSSLANLSELIKSPGKIIDFLVKKVQEFFEKNPGISTPMSFNEELKKINTPDVGQKLKWIQTPEQAVRFFKVIAKGKIDIATIGSEDFIKDIQEPNLVDIKKSIITNLPTRSGIAETVVSLTNQIGVAVQSIDTAKGKISEIIDPYSDWIEKMIQFKDIPVFGGIIQFILSIVYTLTGKGEAEWSNAGKEKNLNFFKSSFEKAFKENGIFGDGKGKELGNNFGKTNTGVDTAFFSSILSLGTETDKPQDTFEKVLKDKELGELYHEAFKEKMIPSIYEGQGDTIINYANFKKLIVLYIEYKKQPEPKKPVKAYIEAKKQQAQERIVAAKKDVENLVQRSISGPERIGEVTADKASIIVEVGGVFHELELKKTGIIVIYPDKKTPVAFSGGEKLFEYMSFFVGKLDEEATPAMFDDSAEAKVSSFLVQPKPKVRDILLNGYNGAAGPISYLSKQISSKGLKERIISSFFDGNNIITNRPIELTLSDRSNQEHALKFTKVEGEIVTTQPVAKEKISADTQWETISYNPETKLLTGKYKGKEFTFNLSSVYRRGAQQRYATEFEIDGKKYQIDVKGWIDKFSRQIGDFSFDEKTKSISCTTDGITNLKLEEIFDKALTPTPPKKIPIGSSNRLQFKLVE